MFSRSSKHRRREEKNVRRKAKAKVKPRLSTQQKGKAQCDLRHYFKTLGKTLSSVPNNPEMLGVGVGEGGVKQLIRKISGNSENNFEKSFEKTNKKKRSLDEGGEEDRKIKRKKMIDRGGGGAMKINGATIQVGEESRKDKEKNNHTRK